MIYTQKRDGFTLIEILLAVTILSILATILIPNIMRRLRKVNVTRTVATIAALKSAIIEYKQDMGHVPTKREGGLEALVTKPNIKGAEKWDGPYVEGKTIPQDAWGNDFIYHATPTEIEKKDEFKYFEIVSYGADGQPGGEGENKDLYAGS